MSSNYIQQLQAERVVEKYVEELENVLGKEKERTYQLKVTDIKPIENPHLLYLRFS